MVTLYHSPRTRSLRVLWLLEELGIPYQLRTLPFTTESLKSPDYLRVSPLGKYLARLEARPALLLPVLPDAVEDRPLAVLRHRVERGDIVG